MNSIAKLGDLSLVLVAVSLAGCAGLEFGKDHAFGDDALVYFEPIPYLFVTTNKECVATATVIALPGEKKNVRIKNGYGSAEVTLAFSNGMLTSVGQKTDTKVPDSITAIGTALGLGTFAEKGTKAECAPTAVLYPIRDGKPVPSEPFLFPTQ